MRNNTFFILFLMSCTSPLWSQVNSQILQGTVVQQADNVPIPNASV